MRKSSKVAQPRTKSTRPYVICHMCTTIDGRILTGRWGKLPGRKSASELYETTAASFGIGAWIVGTTTMREFSGEDQKLKKPHRKIGHDDFIANRDARRFAIGIDAKAKLRFQEGDVDGDHTVVITTERAHKRYRAHLQSAGVSYLVCGKKHVDLPLAMRKLRQNFGLEKLMLEGGGLFNGSMLAAGLVDEISQIIVPMVDGGVGISGVFDVPGDPPKKAAATLKLVSQESLPGGAVWLRYRVG